MDSFYFNDELECRYCGYRFFISGDRDIQFPTFCPECGEIEVFRVSWAVGEGRKTDLIDSPNLNEDLRSGLLSFE